MKLTIISITELSQFVNSLQMILIMLNAVLGRNRMGINFSIDPTRKYSPDFVNFWVYSWVPQINHEIVNDLPPD